MDDSPQTVLVPGAGLGRLAHDLYEYGFRVEANEVSIPMATAAYWILHQTHQGKIHPFAFDFIMNEVSSEDRYQEIDFPDRDMVYNIHMHPTGPVGSLSYTMGDFVLVYSSQVRSKSFHSVVTSFFIDTATNIYEYILIIRHVLKENGTWVNVGPLQWHGNAKLRPSCDELRLLIESMGFRVLLWMVDTVPMNYRDDDGTRQATKVEGYVPLRFVVQRTNHDLDDVDVVQAIQSLRNTRRSL
jgi:carnosine N-methyltransferase